jgi:hypothetical protein
VTAFTSYYSEAIEGEEGTHGQLVRKKVWTAWQRNMRTQLQNTIHAASFHADDTNEKCAVLAQTIHNF